MISLTSSPLSNISIVILGLDVSFQSASSKLNQRRKDVYSANKNKVYTGQAQKRGARDAGIVDKEFEYSWLEDLLFCSSALWEQRDRAFSISISFINNQYESIIEKALELSKPDGSLSFVYPQIATSMIDKKQKSSSKLCFQLLKTTTIAKIPYS